MSLSLTEFQAALESVTTGYGRQLLLTHAIAAGGPFTRLYHKHFPVATTANEQPKNTNSMNATLHITVDPQIIEAINNLAASLGEGCTAAPVFDVELEKKKLEVATEAPATPEPKGKGKKANPPAPKTPVEEPEPEPEDEAPTGPELAARITPIKNTPYTKALRAYIDEQLGLAGVKLNEITDNAARKKIDAKITELLKQAETDKADEL